MKWPLHFLLFVLLALGFLRPVSGQNEILIQGAMRDKLTGEALPYASVSLCKRPLGSISNENGDFVLKVGQAQADDSLLFNFIGYKPYQIKLPKKDTTITVLMEQVAVTLTEAIIYPGTAEEYIKRAVKHIRKNHIEAPYQSISYYRESFLENKATIVHNEAMVKSYYPPETDTLGTQHQIVLYRKANDLQAFQFMQDKKNKDTLEAEIRIAEIFGGPKNILNLDLIEELPNCIDAEQMSKYHYQFGPDAMYQGRALMRIDFHSKGTVEYLEDSGFLLIDLDTDAIALLHLNSLFKVPLWAKPILLVAGFSIKDTEIAVDLQYGYWSGKWFPQYFHISGETMMTKKHLFHKNEHAYILFDQLFVVQDIQTENARPIPTEKRFNPEKKIETQVWPEDHINWENQQKWAK